MVWERVVASGRKVGKELLVPDVVMCGVLLLLALLLVVVDVVPGLLCLSEAYSLAILASAAWRLSFLVADFWWAFAGKDGGVGRGGCHV